MASTTQQVVTAAGSTGGTGAGVILLNMYLKAHGYQSLEAQEAIAVMAVVSPIVHVFGLIGFAVLFKIIGWLKLDVPGITQIVDAAADGKVDREEFQAALDAIRRDVATRAAAPVPKAPSPLVSPPIAPATNPV